VRAACKSIGAALPKPDAVPRHSDYFTRSDRSRLDEIAALRLSDAMSKSPVKRRRAIADQSADEESARGRLLGAARHLFCKNGINATGVDAIINEAGTAKTTLYKLFGSKTNLVHVVLETEGKEWRDWFIHRIEAGGGSAQAKLARIFPVLKAWFRQERFYGCPFINAIGEHDKDEKQLRAIAMRHKRIVLAHIEKLAGEMGAAEPQSLAHQLALLMDGAIVAAMVTRNPGVADTAALAARPLLSPTKARKARRIGQPSLQLESVA
jgi:AcrR family transcriptional regulator